ncbi:MAG: energy transducer TonB [Treponema sp.]|jgi:protein TonB|nr:energy transducer TonB [Treponema sp.]
MNKKKLRLAAFIAAFVLHLVVLFFFVIDTEKLRQYEIDNARVMKLTDLAEFIPPPPPPPELDPDIPQVEEIAEIMIESDIPPVQTVVAAGTLHVHTDDDYLPMHLLSTSPKFDERAITSALVYPPIAQRSGIEGRVILELTVDRTGAVQGITILREEPEGRGFGEAAARAFMGRKGIPATSNGEPVSARFRYPVVFRIK